MGECEVRFFKVKEVAMFYVSESELTRMLMIEEVRKGTVVNQ